MQEVNMETQQQTIPPVQENTVVEAGAQTNLNSDKPRSNGFLIALLSILLLISCIIAGFFAYQTQSLVKELTAIKNTTGPTPTVSPSEMPVATGSGVVTGTEDWKTYTNERFSFKYDNGWEVYAPKVEGSSLSLYIGPQSVINEIKELFNRGGGFGGGKFLTMTMSEVSEVPVYKSDEFQNVISDNPKVDNTSVFRYRIDVIQDMQGFDKGDKIETFVIPSGNKYIIISLLDYKYKEAFDQILSTFKFTN